jgi:hypothetical protein
MLVVAPECLNFSKPFAVSAWVDRPDIPTVEGEDHEPFVTDKGQASVPLIRIEPCGRFQHRRGVVRPPGCCDGSLLAGDLTLKVSTCVTAPYVSLQAALRVVEHLGLEGIEPRVVGGELDLAEPVEDVVKVLRLVETEVVLELVCEWGGESVLL